MRWGAVVTAFLVFLLSFCHRLNLPPSAPELLQPENGVRGVSTSVTLLWRASDPNGDPLTFEVFLGEGSEISLIATTTEDHLYVDSLKLDTEYLWKVVAVDPYGEKSESPIWKFRTQAPPSRPAPVYPKDGERGVPVEVELSWESSDPDGDDIFYDVYLGEDSPVPIATSLSATSLKVRLELSRRYIWKVTAVDIYGNSSEGDTWEFETQNPPTAPVPVYPEDGQSAVPISVDLSWSSSDPDGDPLEYEVTVEKDGKTVYSATTNSQSVHVDLEEGSRYIWSVKAMDAYGNSSTGGPWTFTTQHTPKVRLISPEDGQVGVDAKVKLEWEGEDEDEEKLLYDVYIGEGTPELVASSIEQNSYELELEVGRWYEWYVVVRDEAGNESESDHWRFRTQMPPSTPVLIYPVSERCVPRDVVLRWQSSDPDGDELSYRVYIGKEWIDESEYQTGDEKLKVSGLEEGAEYSWKVVAMDGHGNEVSSEEATFVTRKLPQKPRLVYPSDESKGIGVDVEFKWEGDASRYELYLWKTGELEKKVWEGTTTSYSTTLESGLEYSWKVVGIGGCGDRVESDEWSFVTQHTPKVRLISPEDGQVGVDAKVKLEWEGEDEDEEKLLYDVYIGEGTPELVASSIEQNSYELELEVGRWYEWYVVVRDEAGNESESDHWRFRTQMPPSTPALLYPELGRENVPLEVDLRWYSFDPDGDDVSFEVYIGEGTPELVGSVSTNTYHVSLDYSRTYYWKVVAKDDHSNVSESPVASFSTVHPPIPFVDEVVVFSTNSVLGVDVSDPTAPSESWKIQIEGKDVLSAFDSGSKLYVGTCGKVLEFVAGVEVGKYDIPGCALDTIEASGSLYVALGEEGLLRIPLSDPESSDLINVYSLNLDEYMGKVYVAGGEEIYVIDLATPSEIASILDTGGFWVEKLKVIGERVYYLVPRSGIGVLGSPGSFHPIEDILDFDIVGNLVYAVTPSKVVIVNYRTPTSHEIESSVDLAGGKAIKVIEPYVYVIGSGFYVVGSQTLRITGFEDTIIGNSFCR